MNAKIIVTVTSRENENKYFYGKMNHKFQTIDLFEFEKYEIEDVDFNTITLDFEFQGSKYNVVADSRILERGCGNTLELCFSDSNGYFFDLDIFGDKTINLKGYYSRYDFENDEDFISIDDVIVTYL